MDNNPSIRNSINFFEGLVTNTDKIVFAFDINAESFLYLNPAFEKIWNKSIEDVAANPSDLISTIHPEDRAYVLDSFREIINGAEKKEVEFRILFPDKSIRWIVINSYKLYDEAGKQGLAGFAEDISKSKDNEIVLQKFAAKKDSILEILSHDLAGPLNNIKAIAALLTRKLKGRQNPELDKLVKMVEETSERSIRLIREFVKTEFLQSQHAELIKKRVDIVKELREIVEQYKASEIEISKTILFQISSEQIFVDVDVYKFSQVINNLISNAIKFTKDNGVIQLSIEDKQEKVLITVADDGIGIPAKYHEALFEKFNKARRPGLKGEPSVGLGMSIIKTIVDWHGGRIWFDSKEGEGSTFYIELSKE
jgi:two-component system, OmpR family, sensor histidine kinase VicK